MLQRPPRPRVNTTMSAIARRRLNVSGMDSRASIAGLVTGPSRDLARFSIDGDRSSPRTVLLAAAPHLPGALLARSST